MGVTIERRGVGLFIEPMSLRDAVLNIAWKYTTSWHFRPTVQHATSVPQSPAYNPKLTLLTLTIFERLAENFYLSDLHRERVVNILNRLPSQTVDFSSLSRFRKSIEIIELDALTIVNTLLQLLLYTVYTVLLLFLAATICADSLPGCHA